MSEEYSGELALAQTTIRRAKQTLQGSEKYRLNMAIHRVHDLEAKLQRAINSKDRQNTKPLYRKLGNAVADLELLVLSIEDLI